MFSPEVKECILTSEYDKKIPIERRIAAYNVRTMRMNTSIDDDGTVLRKKGKKYKDHILQICEVRNDYLGKVVRERVLSTLSDLHAADARYHDFCKINFFSVKNVSQLKEESEIERD